MNKIWKNEEKIQFSVNQIEFKYQPGANKWYYFTIKAVDVSLTFNYRGPIQR